jgi:hypothetical protein
MEKHEQGTFDVSPETFACKSFLRTFLPLSASVTQINPTQQKSPCRPATSVHSIEVHVLRRNEYASMPSPPQLGALELA